MKYNDNGEIKEISVKASDTLPIGTIIDYDGEEVPSGYEIVSNNIKLLWENTNRGNQFAAQNITLSSDDYDLLLFIVVNDINLNYSNNLSVITPKGMGCRIINVGWDGTKSEAITRNINYVNDTTYAVANCSNNGTTSNIRNIPLKIYGIKF